MNMDPISVVGLVLSAVGVVLSVWALHKADSAKKAVDRVIETNRDQVTRDHARDLLAKLTDARDAAMARRQGASRLSSAGRSTAGDVKALQIAQDALATATIGSDQGLVQNLRAAASELDRALKAIASNCNRDGWADALGVLQGVIPKIDVLQRELGAKALR